MHKHTFKVARNSADRKAGKFHTLTFNVGDNPRDWGHLALSEDDINEAAIDKFTISIQGNLRRNWPASQAAAQKYVDDFRPGQRTARGTILPAEMVAKFDAEQLAALAAIGVKIESPEEKPKAAKKRA